MYRELKIEFVLFSMLILLTSCSERRVITEFCIEPHLDNKTMNCIKNISKGYKREINAPFAYIYNRVPELLADSYLFIAENDISTFFIVEIGYVQGGGSVYYAEFPMLLRIINSGKNKTTIKTIPLDEDCIKVDEKYKKAYKIQQEFFARRLMYRIAVETESKKIWPWLFETKKVDDNKISS